MDYAQKKHEGHTMSMTHFFYNNMWAKGGRKKLNSTIQGTKNLEIYLNIALEPVLRLGATIQKNCFNKKSKKNQDMLNIFLNFKF